MQAEKEMIVFTHDTWGNYGQHDKFFILYWDEERNLFVPVWERIPVRWIREDSAKNKHRKGLVKQSELPVGIYKVVHDYASSSRRRITVTYFLNVDGKELKDLPSETLRTPSGFVDVVQTPAGEIKFGREGRI